MDASDQPAIAMARQLSTYRKEDPEPAQEMALPMEVVEAMAQEPGLSEKDRIINDLVGGAIYFCMRSCEYSNPEAPRETEIITVSNMVFRKGSRVL